MRFFGNNFAHPDPAIGVVIATAKSLATDEYKLFPSPRNMLIDMESYYLKGRYSLFAACRLTDNKMGQLVTLEDAADEVKFNSKFVPD